MVGPKVRYRAGRKDHVGGARLAEVEPSISAALPRCPSGDKRVELMLVYFFNDWGQIVRLDEPKHCRLNVSRLVSVSTEGMKQYLWVSLRQSYSGPTFAQPESEANSAHRHGAVQRIWRHDAGARPWIVFPQETISWPPTRRTVAPVKKSINPSRDRNVIATFSNRPTHRLVN